MEMTPANRDRGWSMVLETLALPGAAMLVSGSWQILRVQGRCWDRGGALRRDSGFSGQPGCSYPITRFLLLSPLTQEGEAKAFCGYL